jgi:hypothetical protein
MLLSLKPSWFVCKLLAIVKLCRILSVPWNSYVCRQDWKRYLLLCNFLIEIIQNRFWSLRLQVSQMYPCSIFCCCSFCIELTYIVGCIICESRSGKNQIFANVCELKTIYGTNVCSYVLLQGRQKNPLIHTTHDTCRRSTYYFGFGFFSFVVATSWAHIQFFIKLWATVGHSSFGCLRVMCEGVWTAFYNVGLGRN